MSRGKYNGDLRTWLMLSHAFNVGLDELLKPVWGEPAGPGSGTTTG